jgi:hypothetical protein
MAETRSGVLAGILQDAMDKTGASMKDLTVLSPKIDPYRIGTPQGHTNGQWFAEMLTTVAPGVIEIQLRGFHYRLVAHGGILKPDGALYLNNDQNWVWLQQDAAKAGRYLGYVPFARIRDERNAEPDDFVPDKPGVPRPFLSTPSISALDKPTVAFETPHFWLSESFRGYQPYRIILLGEKSSLADVLKPLAYAYGCELILPNGEPTDTRVYGIAMRAAEDGRPAIVLYFSDFDPSGWQMPISVARKLQALKDLEFPNLDIQVHRVALTIEQVKGYNLPSTPLKDTEKRSDDWYAEWGHEQTEIDALAALRPDILSQIAEDAILKFFDVTLPRREDAAEKSWKDAAEKSLTDHPNYESLRTCPQSNAGL